MAKLKTKQLYSGLAGDEDSISADDTAELTKLILSILSDPAIMRSLSRDGGGGGGMMAASQPGPAGYVTNPTPQGMWGDTPGPGPVQWLGGMPPGYNDDVAKKLAISANLGNILSPMLAGRGQGGMSLGQQLGQGLGSGLGGLLSKLFGGGKD